MDRDIMDRDMASGRRVGAGKPPRAALLLAGLLALAATLAPGAMAQSKVVKIGLIQDFTVVYTFVTDEYNQGQQDYLELVNLNGGVDGYTFEALVTDTGNQPQRGIEAYERFKREGAVVFDFLSTPVSRAIVPRSLDDGSILITPVHGRSDATDGTTFPTIFPTMATYWSQATVIAQYILDQEGGNLQGKKVALVHIDSPFGREPIPVFETLAGRLGFEFQNFPYPSPGTEQSATWTQVRRFQPDWVVLWGAGGGQPVAVREAIRNGFRTDRIVSVVWLAEKDMQVVGAQQAKGVLRFEPAAAGTEPALIQAILDKVYGAGRGHGDRANVGSSYYNYGVASMATVVEGVRVALEQFGEPLTTDKIRRGLESLQAFDAEGLMPPITLTPEDHEGGGVGRIAQWDGSRWVPQTDWYSAYRDIVWELVRASAAQFRATGE